MDRLQKAGAGSISNRDARNKYRYQRAKNKVRDSEVIDMIKGIIDRFECDLAVIEVNGHTVEYPKYLLPAEAEAGDVVIINGNQFTLDKEETKKRKQKIDELINELFED